MVAMDDAKAKALANISKLIAVPPPDETIPLDRLVSSYSTYGSVYDQVLPLADSMGIVLKAVGSEVPDDKRAAYERMVMEFLSRPSGLDKK